METTGQLSHTGPSNYPHYGDALKVTGGTGVDLRMTIPVSQRFPGDTEFITNGLARGREGAVILAVLLAKSHGQSFEF